MHLLVDELVAAALGEKIAIVWENWLDAHPDDAKEDDTLADFVLGEHDTFLDHLAGVLEDADEEELEDLLSYPDFVYLGLGERYLWERYQQLQFELQLTEKSK